MNKKNNSGYTPLHLAAKNLERFIRNDGLFQYYNIETDSCLCSLLSNGADVTIKDKNGNDFMDLIGDGRVKDVVDDFRKKIDDGFDVKQPDV